MATFAELCADVHIITNRPDLVADTKLAVKAATLKAHHSDFYAKDLVESGIEWATPDYYQSLEYRTLFPRFRALKFLRKYDAAGSTSGAFFTILTPDQILDSYGIEKADIAYTAGEMLEIKSSTQDSNMLIGYYQHPIIEEATYSSWVALDHPYAIVYDAARMIFKQTGWDEQAAQMNMIVQEQYVELRNYNLAVVGH